MQQQGCCPNHPPPSSGCLDCSFGLNAGLKDEKDGKDEKDYFFFIEGACDRFLLSDFPVLAQNRFAWMESRWESSLS